MKCLEKILSIGRIEKLSFFESAILEFFLLHSHENQSKCLEQQENMNFKHMQYSLTKTMTCQNLYKTHPLVMLINFHAEVIFWMMFLIILLNFVAFCSFFPSSPTVVHRGRQLKSGGRQQKSGGRQQKSSRAGQQYCFSKGQTTKRLQSWTTEKFLYNLASF